MKVHRPLVLLATLTIVVALLSTEALARTDCAPTPQGVQCVSQVDFTTFRQSAFKTQERSQWCWAASISMLFSYYGHPVSQENIVQSLYGRTVNLPSGNGWNIASRLNRDWVDANNASFEARVTAAYDIFAGVNTLNNAWIVNELDQDRPFVIGTKGHAVVGTAIRYVPTPGQPIILGIGVFDPWPGRGARWLDPAEMTAAHLPGGALQFLATVIVQDK